eukprot:CAMPEP_0172736778 /NCGR_PEP_ID=MMETSP1074-20121228/115952_1 /TAXON_ID=2916 /ORGANISM="Ceratium fusus, Strain PA161109" /LENGTH=43 /DNA_ID= /DNA_START= /DNA_END= /DNA_ORIENTATION=
MSFDAAVTKRDHVIGVLGWISRDLLHKLSFHMKRLVWGPTYRQ